MGANCCTLREDCGNSNNPVTLDHLTPAKFNYGSSQNTPASGNSKRRHSRTQSPRKNLRDLHEVKNIKSLFEFKRQIGSGSYGTVFQAINKKSGEQCAVKVIHKEHKSEKQWYKMMRSELTMLKELNHPNLVRVFELCEDKNYIYEVAELVQHGDLFNMIERICEAKKSVSERQVAKWIVQILEALNYLHT